jgi:hypothetical protein
LTRSGRLTAAANAPLAPTKPPLLLMRDRSRLRVVPWPHSRQSPKVQITAMPLRFGFSHLHHR